MRGNKREKVSVRWMVENAVSIAQANGGGEWTAKSLAEELGKDESGVRKALQELVERGTLKMAGRGKFVLAGAETTKVAADDEPKAKKAGGKKGAMDARMNTIEDLLRTHGPLTRAALAEFLGDNAGDVKPSKSGSTTLWKMVKAERIVREGKTFKIA